MRLNAAQAGLTFSQGRYELYIQLIAIAASAARC